MSEIVERVAKAMFTADQPKGEPFNEFRWGHTAANYRLLARAAIEVIKPLEMMGTEELIQSIPKGVLISLVMKLTGGSANPNVVAAIIDRHLGH